LQKQHSKRNNWVGIAIAIGCGSNREGRSKNFNDTRSKLYRNITLIKGIMNLKDGFFLRSESFYNFATIINEPYFGGRIKSKKKQKIIT